MVGINDWRERELGKWYLCYSQGWIDSTYRMIGSGGRGHRRVRNYSEVSCENHFEIISITFKWLSIELREQYILADIWND